MDQINCLDHGFVRLVDFMGNDAAVVQAARVSYGEGTKQIHEDRGLIRYLMRHRHTTPFEMLEAKFHCKMPIFVARQWIRHRTANVNEMSLRYSEASDHFYVPEPEQVRKQSKDNKQGRGEGFSERETESMLGMICRELDRARTNYKNLCDNDLARELARIILPVSFYTEWYWKIDLHNLFHFLKLRLDSHAQYEIRVYAEAIAQIIKPLVPICWEAFEDYVLNAVTFSAMEMKLIRSLLEIEKYYPGNDGLSVRERTEFFEKIGKRSYNE